MAWLVLCLGLLPMPAAARGLFLQEAPWDRPALADTALALEFGVTATRSDTAAFLISGVISPVRRGPLRLAFSLDWVSVHTAAGRAFGSGDPKAFARLRLYGGDSTFAALHIAGIARVPLAKAELFPYAFGGQEIEFFGSLGLGRKRGAKLGAGYIWSEPPSGGRLHSADVPHSVHTWAVLEHGRGAWVARARGDWLFMEGSRWRQQVEASLVGRGLRGLRPSFVAGGEFGPAADRVVDAYVALRFAMPLH